jgi:hypothetical protein
MVKQILLILSKKWLRSETLNFTFAWWQHGQLCCCTVSQGNIGNECNVTVEFFLGDPNCLRVVVPRLACRLSTGRKTATRCLIVAPLQSVTAVPVPTTRVALRLLNKQTNKQTNPPKNLLKPAST